LNKPSYVEQPTKQVRPSEAEGFFYSGTHMRCRRFRPGQRSGVVLSETGPDHLHVIAEEVSRVMELCITQDMGTMGTAKAFREVEAGSVNPDWFSSMEKLRKQIIHLVALFGESSLRSTLISFSNASLSTKPACKSAILLSSII
jgi:hypothetical protein